MARIFRVAAIVEFGIMFLSSCIAPMETLKIRGELHNSLNIALFCTIVHSSVYSTLAKLTKLMTLHVATWSPKQVRNSVLLTCSLGPNLSATVCGGLE